ncbi:MAG: hypothetical protein ACTSPW_16700, partial [Promethearchaeota archaeon]
MNELFKYSYWIIDNGIKFLFLDLLFKDYMSEMLYISVTIILYLIFFSLITVFGNSVLKLIFNFRGITWNYTFLEGLPFSIIIGLLLYLVYSYMFAFLGLFNFWY